MGFKTGIAASVDLLALSSFCAGAWARKSESGEGGDEFLRRAAQDGLKEALEWREEKFGNRYRESSPDE